MQAQFINLPQGPQEESPFKSPLDTLQQLMMMKQAYDQEEKQRQAQMKDQINQMKMQQQMQKDLFEYKAQQEEQQRKMAFQEGVKQKMGAFEGLKQGIEELSPMGPFQPGQEPPAHPLQQLLPLFKHQAALNQNMPAGMFTQSMKESVNPIDIFKQGMAQSLQGQKDQAAEERLGMKTGSAENIAGVRAKTAENVADIGAKSRREVAGIKADTALDLAGQNNQAKITMQRMKDEGLRLKLKNDKEIAELNYKLKTAKYPQDAWEAANNMIEKVAKNLAGSGEEVTPEHRAKATEHLARNEPEVFGKYIDKMQQEEPGLFSRLIKGFFGGGNEKEEVDHDPGGLFPE